MSWFLVVPGVLGALLVAGGVAAIRNGWILPFQRHRVHRTRLFGWAQLVMAAAFAAQVAGQLLDEGEARFVPGLVALFALLVGLVLAVLAQRPSPDR
ncbi:putative membrane protein AbrB (regulator of aidB expression) [Streptomyces sp. PvR006]|uniref:hypothetical protein n=1 Tax=unclassified Streptomyces TaxID=2593676 RepID=UPI001AE9E90D|nr:hypothetical protein [Streptomyces sp. PvR006]MBP2580330.1 putative membrane protein AbrB (regulator of aidB expression) [Streptomyces sp. PvR006]